MKKKIIMSMVLISLLFGCATSLGTNNWNEAKRLEKEKDYAGVLVNVTEALVKDGAMNKAKAYLRKNFDTMVQDLLTEVKSLEGNNSIAAVERTFDIYLALYKSYSNLKKLKLPLAEDNFLFFKGKTWTTELVDYTDDLEKARVNAFEQFYIKGSELLADEQIKEAYNTLSHALAKFQVEGSEELVKKTDLIANDFSNTGDLLIKSKDLKKTIQGYNAYFYSNKILPDFERAIKGMEKASKLVAALYIEEGLKLDSKQTLESYIEATEMYKKALEWEPTNDKAKSLLEKDIQIIVNLYIQIGQNLERKNTIDSFIQATEAYKNALTWDNKSEKAQTLLNNAILWITEAYYNLGIKYDKNNDIDNALENYNLALQWTPNYKDIHVRINKIYLSKELILLEENLATTQGEFNKVNSKVSRIKKNIDSAVDGMGQITYIADKTIEINDGLKNTKLALTALTAVPIVGSVISTLQKAIDMVQDPIDPIASKFKRIKQPVITPVQNALEKTQGYTGTLEDSMTTIADSIQKTRSMINTVNNCIETQQDKDVIKQIENSAKEINKGVVEVNKNLVSSNEVLDSADDTASKISNMIPNVQGVTKAIKSIAPTLNDINSVASEINKVLNKKITINIVITKYSFTIRDILDGAASISNLFMKAAMKLIDPLLDQLNIKFPSIPGLDELSNSLDYLESKYKGLEEDGKKMLNSANDIKSNIMGIENQLINIQNLAGCEN